MCYCVLIVGEVFGVFGVLIFSLWSVGRLFGILIFSVCCSVSVMSIGMFVFLWMSYCGLLDMVLL